jgi:ribonuclease HI
VKILRVHPHPALSRQVSLWLAGRRRPWRRQHYKHYVRHAGIRRGLRVETSRADKWKTSSAAAATGLAMLEWKRIRRVLGLGPWGEQVLYRLKARAFSVYDVRNDRLGCPHDRCVHEGDVDIYHVFWTGPAARQLRKTFITPWKRLGLEGSTEEHACFSLELPAVPQAIWELAATSNMQAGAHDALLDVNITALMEGCWRLGAALYFHAVWRWRVEHFDETNDVSAARHNLLLVTRLREGYASMHFYVDPTGHRRLISTAAGVVKQALRQPWNGSHQAVGPLTADCCYLLFFDGGSRGNPGPGGSGATVVRWPTSGGAFQLVWAGSMSYAAQTTTNNVAEYMGLIVGLTACCKFGFSPLHVIGDSALIIRQQLTRTPPKAKHLQPLYWKCRRLHAGTRVLSWQHHLRAYNKMADGLANMAMDTKKSIQTLLDQPTLRLERWSTLVNNAGGDIGH